MVENARAIVFDLDGTLFDLTPVVHAARQRVAAFLFSNLTFIVFLPPAPMHSNASIRSNANTVLIIHPRPKSNAALSKSPTKRVRTQSNHCFMAIYAACRLEGLRVKHRLNHFALRSRLYLKAIRYAFHELQILKAA